MENLNNLGPTYGLDWTKMGGDTVIGIIQDEGSGNILATGLISPNGLEGILRSQRKQSAWAGSIILSQSVVTKEIYCDCDKDTVLIKVEGYGPEKALLESRYQFGSLKQLHCCSKCSRDRCQILAVTQDEKTGEVQMVGVMSQEAVAKTIQTGFVTFWSRSRKVLWTKGETSSNYLRVQKVLVDLASCSVVLVTSASGPVCHIGAMTCFHEPDGSMRVFETK